MRIQTAREPLAPPRFEAVKTKDNTGKFVINFEPDSILSFKNSNEQGLSFKQITFVYLAS